MLAINTEERLEDKRILIVEDDAMTRSIIERSFSVNSQQFHTTTCRSLKEALQLTSDRTFDAIVADYHLGDGNASFLMSKNKETPFIVVTGDNDTTLATHLIKMGVDEFVSKDAELKFVNTLPIITESAIERRSQINKYKKEEKTFRQLFENSSVIIQSVDDQDQLIYANGSWMRTLGYDKGEFQGLHFLDVIHPFDHKYARNLYTKIGPGVHINNVRLRFIDKKGDIIHVSGTINCTDDKRPFVIHGMFNNITEEVIAQKKLSRSEKKYRELVETADDTICRIDYKGNFWFINEHGEKLTGYDKKDLIGTHALSLVREDYKKYVADFLGKQHKEKKPSGYIEFPIVAKNGAIIWVGQKMTEYKKGKFIRGYQLVIRDITNKKLAEKKILEQKEKLEEQHKIIKENYKQLLKARIGRRALIIVLLVAVGLFVLSEIFLEPLIERYTDSNYVGLILKGGIALILKPLESFIENYLTKRNHKPLNDATV